MIFAGTLIDQSTTKYFPKRHILIVDDEAVNVKMCEKALTV